MKTSVKAKHENNGGTNGQSELNSRCHKKVRKKKIFVLVTLRSERSSYYTQPPYPTK